MRVSASVAYYQSVAADFQDPVRPSGISWDRRALGVSHVCCAEKPKVLLGSADSLSY